VKTWKIQKFFGDVIYDLRSRGLLPLAALLLVAMLAVPVLIARMGTDAPPPPDVTAAESAAELAPENQNAVLAYSPGVRDYRKRLNDLPSKDPFVQQFAGPADAAAELPEATDVAASGTGTGTSTGSGGGTATGGDEEVVTENSGGKVETRYYFYETDVLIGEVNTQLTRRNRIQPFTYLPSLQTPVLVFLGNSSNGKRAIFLVSDGVIGQAGAGACSPSPEDCQLLSLAPGETEDLVYGLDNKTYRIKVQGIKLKVSNKPPKG
jgi:hypothetical protein